MTPDRLRSAAGSASNIGETFSAALSWRTMPAANGRTTLMRASLRAGEGGRGHTQDVGYGAQVVDQAVGHRAGQVDRGHGGLPSPEHPVLHVLDVEPRHAEQVEDASEHARLVEVADGHR